MLLESGFALRFVACYLLGNSPSCSFLSSSSQYFTRGSLCMLHSVLIWRFDFELTQYSLICVIPYNCNFYFSFVYTNVNIYLFYVLLIRKFERYANKLVISLCMPCIIYLAKNEYFLKKQIQFTWIWQTETDEFSGFSDNVQNYLGCQPGSESPLYCNNGYFTSVLITWCLRNCWFE